MSELSVSQNFIEDLQKIAASGHVSHAYILEGEDRKFLLSAAKEFAKALGTSAADVLFPEREKPNLITVEDIRQGINSSVYIKPYNSPRKVYILEEAEKMNPQAQNALLKTLEEPPAYVVILLLTANVSAFLPTILSRCVKLTFQTGEEEEEGEKAEAMALSGEILRNAPDMDTKAMLDFVGRAAKLKNSTADVLEELRVYLRDIMIYKAESDEKLLLRPQALSSIKTAASRLSYAGITRVIDALDRTERRLEANVNTELSLELFLITLREEIQRR